MTFLSWRAALDGPVRAYYTGLAGWQACGISERSFMATGFFFINLDRDQERCAHMLRSAALLGKSFTRIEAVDLTSFAESLPVRFSPFKFSNERWTLRPFEIAVFESHRRAWTALLETEHELGLIMEDDMLFESSFAQTITRLETHQSLFDIIKLNHSVQPRRLGPPIRGFHDMSLRMVHENIADAGCYIVTRHAAESLLEQSETYCSHLDDFVFSPDRGLRTLQLIPPIAAQMIYMAEPKQTLATISTRLQQTDQAAKGPLSFRIWKEVRRLYKKGGRRILSKANKGEQVDMSALLSEFRPMSPK